MFKKSFLDDYAYYTAALTELYHSTLNHDYLDKGERFCKEAAKRFADSENGGFYLTAPDNTELFIRPKESYDGAVPSGNSVMAYNFVRLYELTEKEDYRQLAEKQIHYMSSQALVYPAGYSMFLLAKLVYDNPPEHITIALKNISDLEKLREHLPLLANVNTVSNNSKYPLINDRTTFYVCKNHTCSAPANMPGI